MDVYIGSGQPLVTAARRRRSSATPESVRRLRSSISASRRQRQRRRHHLAKSPAARWAACSPRAARCSTRPQNALGQIERRHRDGHEPAAGVRHGPHRRAGPADVRRGRRAGAAEHRPTPARRTVAATRTNRRASSRPTTTSSPTRRRLAAAGPDHRQSVTMSGTARARDRSGRRPVHRRERRARQRRQLS